MKLYLTSSPTGSYRAAEAPSYAGLNPENGLVAELSKDWKQDSRCMIVSADPDAWEMNEGMKDFFEQKIRESGLSVSGFDLCDSRNGSELSEQIGEYDMILLGGGHVPTQNHFLHQIGLPEKLRGFDGIVMGISAGTMNCADTVYAQPELPGESEDPDFQRFIPGLGLTKWNILPHYQAVKDDILDGKRLMEEITYPDSMGRKFLVLPDGSFLLEREEKSELHGKAYLIEDGSIRKICENGEILRLNF